MKQAQQARNNRTNTTNQLLILPESYRLTFLARRQSLHVRIFALQTTQARSLAKQRRKRRIRAVAALDFVGQRKSARRTLLKRNGCQSANLSVLLQHVDGHVSGRSHSSCV